MARPTNARALSGVRLPLRRRDDRLACPALAFPCVGYLYGWTSHLVGVGMLLCTVSSTGTTSGRDHYGTRRRPGGKLVLGLSLWHRRTAERGLCGLAALRITPIPVHGLRQPRDSSRGEQAAALRNLGADPPVRNAPDHSAQWSSCHLESAVTVWISRFYRGASTSLGRKKANHKQERRLPAESRRDR